MFSQCRYLYGSETHSTNVMLIKCAHAQTYSTHTFTPDKLNLPQLKENTDLFFRTTHALSTVCASSAIYRKYNISFKYFHWEINITHCYSIYVSAYCRRQSHSIQSVQKKKKNYNNSGTIHSYCPLDVFKAYHTYFTCFTYDTHQSVGSKTTADVQYTFSVEPDILLPKEIVVVQFSHQVFDTAIQHTVSPVHPHIH